VIVPMRVFFVHFVLFVVKKPFKKCAILNH